MRELDIRCQGGFRIWPANCLDFDRIDVDPTAGQFVMKTKICAPAGDRTMEVTYDCTD
jgi:hypothetical protein